MTDISAEILETVRNLRVPAIDTDDPSRPYEASDFSAYTSCQKTADGFTQLHRQLERCIAQSHPLCESVMAEVLIVLAEHTCECEKSPAAVPWSSAFLRSKASLLTRPFLVLTECADIASFVSCAEGDKLAAKVTHLAVERLADAVRPQQWRCMPAAACSLLWLTRQCSGAALWQRLPALLPAILLLLDDFEPRHQCAAIAAASHVLDQVPPSRLRQMGRAQVLADAVQRVARCAPLHAASDSLASWLAALPVALRLLIVAHGVDGAQVSRHVRQFLLAMSTHSCGADVRRECLQHVFCIVSELRVASVCWLRLILDVLAQYVDVMACGGDASSVSIVSAYLDVLDAILIHCRRRLKHHRSQLHFILLKLLYEVTTCSLTSHFQQTTSSSSLISVEALTQRVCRLACDLHTATDTGMIGDWRHLLSTEPELPDGFVSALQSVCEKFSELSS